MYICIYVYMYICIFVYMYICIDVYMYIFIYVYCIYVYMYICIYVYMYICIYVYMYISIYVYVYVYVFVYVYVSVYLHVYVDVDVVVDADVDVDERFEFLVVSGAPVLCAVACFHTRTDTQHGHSTARRHTAQSYYSFLFLMWLCPRCFMTTCMCIFRDLEIGLSKGISEDLGDGERSVRRAKSGEFLVEARSDNDAQIVCLRRKTNRTIKWLFFVVIFS